ncbi:MAG: bifunctional UDP-N-acetylglucosamine diphosphorylase/glucosamine-1-phosphate N-acetyltransferase GlmU, partial [Deltaproteobacteria bacterium]|nr:bifunctional UDP-N-acetylglucosamine diphosphorylase/glucosamine-1-phosphate N-acetyltransferase GlmU [Deltaproteobacteria bacterium]
MTRKTAAIILAAGQGKRMRSSMPKVLHLCGGLPLVSHVVRLALARRCDPIVVVVDPRAGKRVRELLTAQFPAAPLRFAVQERPLGTGDAVRSGLGALRSFGGRVLVLYGDVPLLRAVTLSRLERALGRLSLAMLTAEVEDATGYGRVVRNGAKVKRVVEHRDASARERAIREINAGVYVADAALWRRAVGGLGRRNAQREVYLTDVVALAAEQRGVAAVAADRDEVRGVNTRAELQQAERLVRRRSIAHHEARGCTFLDADSVHLGPDVLLGKGVVVGVGVQLWGRVKVAAGARIDGPSFIRDSVIGTHAVVNAFSHVEGADIGAGASIGPFARVRPGTRIEEGARVGNFVETKKARLGKGAKANHLAYLGDVTVGAGSNIGAGTITCNYD